MLLQIGGKVRTFKHPSDFAFAVREEFPGAFQLVDQCLKKMMYKGMLLTDLSHKMEKSGQGEYIYVFHKTNPHCAISIVSDIEKIVSE